MMGSIINDKRMPQVRLTRKVVSDFVEHKTLPDSNGVTQRMQAANGNTSNARSPDKYSHDSKIHGEYSYFHNILCEWRNRSHTSTTFLTLLMFLFTDFI